MTSREEIKFVNRQTGALETEKVYGDKLIRFLYNSAAGKASGKFLCRRPFSQAYGFIQSSPISKLKIKSFIKNFSINMDEYEPVDNFNCFNDFFIRKFKEGKRNFTKDLTKMGAFAEARYLGFEEVYQTQTFPVKGKDLTSLALLKDPSLAEKFLAGPMLIARLCPVDYHRFHFPDNGRLVGQYRINGELHSVNPLALRFKDDIFAENERVVSILETENFGTLAYIEVGAMCVGKIKQTHTANDFLRGDEKGLFLFGGSTVIVLGQKGVWRPSDDILNNSKKELETYIKLGDEVASKLVINQ